MLYSARDRRAARVRRGAWRAGRRDAGGQGRAARGTIRCSWARSASPARRRPTRSRATPTSCSRSARGCRTSRPARIRCSRRRDARRAQRQRVRRAQVARRGAASPTRGSGSTRCRARSPAGARTPRGRDRARGAAERLARRHRAHHRPARGRAAVRRRRDRRRAALGRGFADARHRRLRGGHAARPSCTSSGARRCPAAITWSTATRAWATRSPAASA